ncbi:MAG: hypothetical protein KJ000_04970 [Pirellulaceae bacterium]|nr:hypothetical protein [Pirellulaceae bacterium]
MSGTFDPYHRWLGIPPEEQPPHHYRLLGIAPFESDREVIDSVAMRHIGFLQEITDAAHVKHAQRLLNELAAARRCLLDPDKKAAYDAELRLRLAESIPAPPPLVRQPDPAQPISATEHAAPAELPSIIQSTSPAVSGKTKTTMASRAKSRAASKGPLDKRRRAFLVGGVAGLLVFLLFVAWLSGRGRQTEEPAPELVSQPDQPAIRERETSSAAQAGSLRCEGAEPRVAHEGEPPGTTQAGSLRDEGAAPPLPGPELDDPQPTFTEQDLAASPPRKFDGLALWLDAADRATLQLDDSSRVMAWSDKSDGRFQASADNADSRPRYADAGLGDHPVVRFAGRANLSLPRTTEPLNLGGQYTVLYIARGGEGSLLSKGTGDSSGSFAWMRGAAGLQIGGDSFAVRGDTGREARVRVVRADQDGIGWFIDGHDHRIEAAGDYELRTNRVLRLGCVARSSTDLQQFFQGDLAELLIYNRALDDAERKTLEDYLAEKWLHSSDAPQPLTVDLAASIAADESTADATDQSLATDATAGDDAGDPPALDPTMPAEDDAPASEPKAAAQVLPKGYLVLTPSRLEASGDSQLRLLDGGVILSDGTTRENESYRILMETPPQTITALRLEALPHESLPGTGPGWGLAGRFALSQFRVLVEAVDGTQPARKVGFTAVAEPKDDLAKRLVDDSDDSAWTVRRRGETVSITFLPTMPLELPAGSRLNISLVQRENLGCFRLLATSDADPLAAPGPIPGNIGGQADDRFTLFVNLGGDAYQDEAGNKWQKSEKHGVRDFGHEGGSSAGKSVQAYPQQLWAETAIRGLTGFRATVPDGVYEITLCFCEQWTNDADRRRFIAVWERGTPQAFQRVFHGPGISGPVTHVEPKVLVRDGRLDIEFSPLDSNSFAILNGIVIRQAADAAQPGRKR